MTYRPYLLILPALMLAACSGSNDSTTPPATSTSGTLNTAVIATAAPDFSSGALSLASLTTFDTTNNLDATSSDISIRGAGDHFFLIKRYGTDQVQRYETSTPTTPTYTYSTNDSSGTDSNPYDLVVLNDTKGYLIRYGSGQVWIVNPSATTEAAFMTGTIDLSQYDADGIPEMSAGLIKNGLLYVAMQRLTNFAATQNGYVAVIDTTTDKEVATYPTGTGTTAPALQGIELPVRDPLRLVSVPDSTAVLAIADGGYDGSFTALYNGGIVSIDHDGKASDGYTATLLLSDGGPNTHPYGQLLDMDAAASDRAYFVGSGGSEQSVFRFNPSGAAPVTPVAVTALQNLNLGPISEAPNGDLWVGQTNSQAPGIIVVGFQNGAETIADSLINTNLSPLNIDFVEVPAPKTTN